MHGGRNATAGNRLSLIMPLGNKEQTNKKKSPLLSVTDNAGVGKSHSSPPPLITTIQKVAEASIKGKLNKAESLSSRNEEL